MKSLVKRLARRLLPNHPKPAMSIDNVYGYLDALWRKKDIPGPVVEIGCAAGGTTALACQFLSRIHCQKPYFCVDTFSGFVREHLSTDHELGLAPNHDRLFSDNSVQSFSDNLRRWGIRENLHVIKGDICQIDKESLPDNISVCLLDVDLRDPIYYALTILKERMADGGVILVDDCKEGTSWVGANVGYNDFVMERGLEPKYYMGFGVIEIPDQRGSFWSFAEKPNSIPNNFYG